MRGFLLLLTVTVGMTAPAWGQSREVIRVPGMLPDSLPFSSAVRVGDLLFLSGQIGRNPATGQLAPGGIGPETRQTMENIKATLEYAGSSMARVVKCTVFLGDMRDYLAMNAVYATFFPTDPPARSAFGANGLALDAKVEIECFALAGPAERQ